MNKFVFFSSALTIGVLGALTVFYPEGSKEALAWAQDWVGTSFGWWYVLLLATCLGFVLWLAFSRYGNVVLGADDEKPHFGYVAWVAMLFSAGIGIALLYYGAYEPLDHFLNPPDRIGGTIDAARNGMMLTFLHWGLHGWALYALVGVALGYFSYRRGLPLALRSALYPIFGARIYGRLGDSVDGFGILATLISMITNLGIGALVVKSGLIYLFGLPDTPHMLVIIVLVMMLVATAVVMAGVEKGIARLSEINVWLLCLLLLFVLSTGPTRLLINGLVQNTGDYLSALLSKSFDLYLFSPQGHVWFSAWTVFYWAWWSAWAPFVGMFVARISRGRTIRQVVLGVMLIPLGFTLAWLSIFGNTVIDLVLNHGQTILGEVAKSDSAMTLYKMLEYLPAAPWIAGAVVIIGFVLFLSPVDSGTLMIANLCTRRATSAPNAAEDREDHDAPVWMRIFWSAGITVASISLLLVGSFSAMQTAVVLCGLPFSLILLLYVFGLLKDLRAHEGHAAQSVAAAPAQEKSGEGGQQKNFSEPTADPVR
ncbi:MAG: BCCT family transporter [Gallionellaceae bacterium]|nr:BCCT family transporter [Gallionellaceae bacterium]